MLARISGPVVNLVGTAPELFLSRSSSSPLLVASSSCGESASTVSVLSIALIALLHTVKNSYTIDIAFGDEVHGEVKQDKGIVWSCDGHCCWSLSGQCLANV